MRKSYWMYSIVIHKPLKDSGRPVNVEMAKIQIKDGAGAKEKEEAKIKLKRWMREKVELCDAKWRCKCKKYQIISDDQPDFPEDGVTVIH